MESEKLNNIQNAWKMCWCLNGVSRWKYEWVVELENAWKSLKMWTFFNILKNVEGVKVQKTMMEK